ncbi:MotA/TolQ/ExbB proton channel family protein [Chelativorans xinjiangense]|uniref:MotA/TolQ/ExbB proton channel family protein n=1 Tax=Chelativorans xinjiangense TaxID=2681485 RepID=UPI001358EA2C|nr:MotA/TolQ/ExbB proton channel family protein [Chelativorans xinjiangense]
MLSHLLLMRLAIVTVAGCVLAIWAHANGFITPIFAADVSRLSYAIVALFVTGLVSTFVRAAKVSEAINRHKADRRADAAKRRKAAKSADKNAHIGAIAGWLQVLGILGTVVGFSIAIGGLEGDETTVVLEGLRTAIGTTILGGFLSLWTSVNAQMLDTATAGFVEDVR